MKQTELYTKEEVLKLIKAYQMKYNISGCDETPYFPEPIYVLLHGFSPDDKPEILQRSIHSFGFSDRVMKVMYSEKIETFGDLIKKSRMQLCRHKGFGRNSWLGLKHMVEQHGYTIRNL
jgi:DNA-directed RNA polymerase alpha subunit